MTYKSTHDASAIANAELQARARGAFAVARQIGGEPCEREADADVEAHGDEEAACVVHLVARGADEHGVADDADDAEEDGVETAFLLAIGKVRDNEVRDGAECVARNG